MQEEFTIEGLWAKVPEKGWGCWLWPTSTRPTVRVAGKGTTAARALYAALRGEIPEGHHVHHTCGEKRCLHPLHLEALPASEHMERHRPAALAPVPMGTSTVAHPSLSAYKNLRCRCPECRALSTEYQREYQRRRREVSA